MNSTPSGVIQRVTVSFLEKSLKWHPDIEGPEEAFPHVARTMAAYLTEVGVLPNKSRWLFLTQCFDGRYSRRTQRRKP